MSTENCFSFLQERGLLAQYTKPDLLNNPQTIYAGFDLTAKSLHAGSLVLIRTLELLSKYGNKIIVLLGSGTSKIGDPTGKTKQRLTLDESTINENKKGIMKTLSSIIKYDLKFVDNIDWLQGIGYIEMLQKYACHFSVNKMVKTELVKTRLDSNLHLSFLELNYSVLQAIDFVVLYEKYGCTIQIGGSDQWTNIIGGVDLGQHMGYEKINGFTIPLLTNKNGVKMGKTEGGALWLDPTMTTPYDFWQYFRSIEDSMVLNLLLIFSDKTKVEIEELVNKNINDAKIELADTLVTYVHGHEWLKKVKTSLDVIYNGADMNLMPEDLRVKFETNVNDSIKLEKILVICGIASSTTEASKMISSGQIRVNGEVATTKYNIEKTPIMKISYGKNIHKIVEFL